MVNIGDVARELGVSRSTVSYALSGKRSVSAETKRRVENAVLEMDFVPSERARALAHSRSMTLAALVPMGSEATPVITLQFVHEAAQASRRRDYDLLMVVGEDPVRDLDRLVLSDRTDGLILLDVSEGDLRLSRLNKCPKPAVLLGWPSEATMLDCVDLDWEETGRLLVDHVAGLGHRVIGLLGVDASAYERHLTYAERFRAGAKKGAAEHGAELVEWVAPSQVADASDSLRGLLAKRPDVTALVVRNEALLPHVHAMAASLGLRIPADISVVGMMLDVFSSMMFRPVSGIENPSARMTSRAVEMLVSRIEDRSSEMGPRRELIAPTFVDRGSTNRP